MPLFVDGVQIDSLYIDGADQDELWVDGVQVFTTQHVLSVISSGNLHGYVIADFGSITPDGYKGNQTIQEIWGSTNTNDVKLRLASGQISGVNIIRFTLVTGLSAGLSVNLTWDNVSSYAVVNASFASALRDEAGNNITISLIEVG